MADQSAKDILLHDPLSDVTRKERRMLLGISMLGVALVKTGLVPTKISALGVEFDKTNQQALLGILALVTLYFAVAFLIYAAADFIAWRRALGNYRMERMRENAKLKRDFSEGNLREEEALLWRMSSSGQALFVLAGPVSVIRALFEFVLPIAVGIYAVQLLWFSVARI